MAFSQVQQGRFEALRVIPKEAQSCVARVAEQPTDAARQMVVVDDEIRDAFWPYFRLWVFASTDGASTFLTFQQGFKHIQGHPILSSKIVSSLNPSPLFWMVLAPFLNLCSRRLGITMITLPGSLLRQLRVLFPPLPGGLGFLLPSSCCFRRVFDLHMITDISKDYHAHHCTH